MSTLDMQRLLKKFSEVGPGVLCLQIAPHTYAPVVKFMLVGEINEDSHTVARFEEGMMYLKDTPLEDFKLVTATEIHEQVTH